MDPTPHIAVVDDQKDIRELVSRYLGEHGYRVSAVESAASCRRLLERSAPDVLVFDITMQGEDGLAMCRDLRATTQPGIIFLTALAADTDRIIGLEMGGDDYLTKPLNPRDLLARIKAVLRRSRSLPVQRRGLQSEKVRFDDKVLDVASTTSRRLTPGSTHDSYFGAQSHGLAVRCLRLKTPFLVASQGSLPAAGQPLPSASCRKIGINSRSLTVVVIEHAAKTLSSTDLSTR